MFKIKTDKTTVNPKNAKSILRNLTIIDGKADLPPTIKVIAKDAFAKIDFRDFGINTLILHNGIQRIECNSFFNVMLEHVFFQNGGFMLKIEEGAFREAKIKKVDICRFVKEIPKMCFYDSDIVSINMESSECKCIGDSAFRDCRILKEIKLPSTLLEINSSAFANTCSLEEIELNISRFSFGVFEESDIKRIKLNTFYDTSIEIEANAFCGCRNLKVIETECPIIKIGDFAFFGCAKLEKIDLSHTTDIGKDAFSNNNLLREIKLNSINTLGESVFEFCDRLAKITIGENLIEIPRNAFMKCENLENFEFSKERNSIKIIGDSAFLDCKKLNIHLYMDSLESVGDNAFSGCRSLQEICFSNVRDIGANAFQNCISLTEVYCKAPIDNIGDFAFLECINLKNVEIYNPLKMGCDVFSKCWNLQNIKFLNNLKGEE